MNKTILISAALLGMLSIIIGAFAAHGLEPLISQEAQQTFETGVRYQMYHAFFLLFLGHTKWVNPSSKKIMLYLIVLGVVFFSGSIYGLATNTLTTFNFKSIGFVTPIGGLLLILAWLLLLINFLKMSGDKS